MASREWCRLSGGSGDWRSREHPGEGERVSTRDLTTLINLPGLERERETRWLFLGTEVGVLGKMDVDKKYTLVFRERSTI